MQEGALLSAMDRANALAAIERHTGMMGEQNDQAKRLVDEWFRRDPGAR